MKDALHGDFGESLKQRGRTVTSIIVSKFPVSARVGGLSVIVALLVGIPLGCLAATHRGKTLDSVISVISTCVYCGTKLRYMYSASVFPGK